MVLFTPGPLDDGDKNKSLFLSVQKYFTATKFEKYICIWIYCILLTFIPIGIKLCVVTEDYLKV